MALSLRDVRCDPIASRALAELMHDYTVAEEEGRVVLTKKAGTMRLFLHALDDLHQWDFIQHKGMLNEREGLRAQAGDGGGEGAENSHNSSPLCDRPQTQNALLAAIIGQAVQAPRQIAPGELAGVLTAATVSP